MPEALCRLATHVAVPGWAVRGHLHEVAACMGKDSVSVAAGRVHYGALLERYARERSASRQRGDAQLYFDAYAASIWTSAHAEYLAVQREYAGEAPTPSIGTFPCASAAPDMSDLFDRRLSPKEALLSESARLLALLLARCTNPGERGWEAALCTALANASVRHVVQTAIVVVLCGTHPMLSPEERPDWRTRMRILRKVHPLLLTCDALTSMGTLVKESLRLYVSWVMGVSLATHAALARLRHPVCNLWQPPATLPKDDQRSLLYAFVQAGCAIAMDRAATSARLQMHVVQALRARTPSAPAPTLTGAGAQHTHSWLGRGTACVHRRIGLSQLAESVCFAAFQAQCAPLWMFGASHGVRLLRLDSTLFDVTHMCNRFEELVSLVDKASAVRIQRAALSDASSELRKLEDVALRLRLESIPPASGCGGMQHAADAMRRFDAVGAQGAAMLFLYAKAAKLAAALLVVELGPRVSRAQCAALRARHCCTGVGELPVHTTMLWLCTTCKRVANAHVCSKAVSTPPFTEVGTSCAQSSGAVDATDSSDSHLFCAKRPPSALRSAAKQQRYCSSERVHERVVDAAGLERAIERVCASPSECGQIRRDVRNAAAQQRTVCMCGKESMLCIRLVGRAVRVYGKWYAFCTLCGAVVQLKLSHNVYGSDVCCMLCAYDMLASARSKSVSLNDRGGASCVRCRFCGIDAIRRSGWVCCRAPHDVAGENATLPSPLRVVWYCPRHHRHWVDAAHQHMETRVILAHIATNARPVFDSAREQEAVFETGKAMRASSRMRIRRMHNDAAKP